MLLTLVLCVCEYASYVFSASIRDLASTGGRRLFETQRLIKHWQQNAWRLSEAGIYLKRGV